MTATWKCGHDRTPENTARFGMHGCCRTCREDRLRRQREATAGRNADIVAAYLAGDSELALSKRYRFTRQHIHKILVAAGVEKREPFADDPLFPDRAIKVAVEHTGYAKDVFLGEWRWPVLTFARFAFIDVMKRRDANYSAIGRMLNRSPWTIMHGYRRAAELRERDPGFVELVERIAAA